MALNAQQIAQYAAQAGFTGVNLVTAVAVALAESSGDPNANNTKGEDSRGLWQINVAQGAHPQLASLNLFDPLVNAQQAFSISSGGTDWGAWSTYTNGAYKAYLNQATLAVAFAGVGQAASGIASTTTSVLGKPPSGPLISIPNPTTIVSNPANDLIDAINNVGSTLAGAANNVTSGISQLQAFIAWLDQPNLLTRIGLAALGFIILVVGIILFGLSFLNKRPTLPVVP